MKKLERRHYPKRFVNHIAYNGETKTLPQWAKTIGIDYRTLRYRYIHGWAIEDMMKPEVRKPIPPNTKCQIMYCNRKMRFKGLCVKHYHEERNARLSKEIYAKNKAKGYDKMWLVSLRSRAKKNNLPFNLTQEDLVFPPFCPILGIPMYHNDRIPTDNSPSVDRIIPKLGYVKGNVQVISHRANKIKHNATYRELLAVGEYVKNLVENNPELLEDMD